MGGGWRPEDQTGMGDGRNIQGHAWYILDSLVVLTLFFDSWMGQQQADGSWMCAGGSLKLARPASTYGVVHLFLTTKAISQASSTCSTLQS